MKKTFAFFALILVLSLSVGVFAACGVKKNQQKVEYNASNFYAFGAASVGAMLENTSSGGAAGAETTTGDETNPDYTELKNYLAVVENFLGNNSLSISEGVADREGYAKQIVSSNRDLSGNVYEYVLYYNESTPVA